MTSCVRCGLEAGGGRFCVQCGLPLGNLDTDTAERPAVPPPGRHAGQAPPPAQRPAPPPPPPPGAPPSNARFPLYADQVPPVAPRPDDAGPRTVSPAAGPPPPLPGPPPAVPLMATMPRAGRGHRVPVVITAVAMLLLAVLAGLWWWLRPGTGERPASTGTSAGSSASSSGGSDGGSSGSSGSPGDLLAGVRADVPAVAPPGQDVNGNPIDYEPDNLFDDDPQTAWRMPGSGAGEDVVIRLAAPGTITEVGLINGYAKVDRDANGASVRWYPRNRRILAVEWRFDDGTTLTQRLQQRPGLQTLDVPDVTTQTVTLHLVEVSPPKAGRLGRDYTAISDLLLKGTPS